MSRRRVLAFCLALSASALLALPALAAARTAYVTGAGFYTAFAVPVDLDTGAEGTRLPMPNEGPPRDVAIAPDGKTAYVVVVGGVVPIDVATNSAGATIATEPLACPSQIAITPDGTRLYVTDPCTTAVIVIDTATRAVVATIALPGVTAAGQVAIDPEGQTAYIVDSGGSSVIPINIAGGIAEAPIEVGEFPFAIQVTPDGSRAYVTLRVAPGAIKRIDLATRAVGPAIPVGDLPESLAITPDSSRAYVAGFVGGIVVPVDLGSGTAGPQIPVATDFLEDIAITPSGSRAWVTGEGQGEGGSYAITPIDVPADTTGTAITSVERPTAIAIVPNQGPRAAFTAAPNPGLRGVSVKFDASASSDSDGSIARYDWDFGDGTVLPNGGPAPTHTYSFGGPHTATLTVTDNEGCSLEVVFPGQTAFCNGGPPARISQQVQTTPKCITINGQASSFVPKYRPAKVVPGLRVRLSASAPARLTVDPTLVWTKNGGGKLSLDQLTVSVQQWRRVRFVIPSDARQNLPLGSKVKLRLRIAAQPLDETLCAPTPVEKTLKLRVVKVIPGAVQAGRPK